MNAKLVVSLTTYPARFERFKVSFKTVLTSRAPKGLNRNDIEYVVNVDDNLSNEDFRKYETVATECKDKGYDVRLVKRDHRWRSANKIVPVYKEYQDVPIVTVDDDIRYPSECIAMLYEDWEQHRDCIVCHESNPLTFNKEWINIVNGAVFKIGYSGFDKYLTNCCLFPPNALNDTKADDLEAYRAQFDCMHDEFWLWAHTTMKGIRVRTLNYVTTFEGEGNMPPDPTALCNTNQKRWAEYNETVSKFYGPEIAKAVYYNRTKIYVNKDRMWTIMGLWRNLVKMFSDPYRVEFVLDKDMSTSYNRILIGLIKRSPMTEAIITSEKPELAGMYMDVDRYRPTSLSTYTEMRQEDLLTKSFEEKR